MFTGDGSGDFLHRSLYKAGFSSQPESRSAEDGLQLTDAWITAAAHCAPPDNKPTPLELRNCRPFLERELEMLTNVQVVVALGKIAFDTYLSVLTAVKSRGSPISDSVTTYAATACGPLCLARTIRAGKTRRPEN
jgi:uracil-DNA glycosylase